MTLYDNIMVVVDETGNELTRERVTEFVKLTGKAAHLVYLANEHIISGEVLTTPGMPDAGNDVEIDNMHVRSLQDYVNRLHNAGVEAHGKVISAPLYGRGSAIVGLALAVSADLVILNTERGGQKAKAKLAADIAAHNPRMAVLIARSTA